jgi:DNA replicative helicase MCM subunit Mcm2 (Cdc46/Mcm family)
MTGKPKSLQDKLRVILNILVEMEKETGTVKRSELLDRLSSDFDVQRGDAERLIDQLTREGTIYEPKIGYLKKT